jgi:hypothetical protein
MSEQFSTLPGAFSTVISDLADLMQKEVRLARAELAEKLSVTIRAGVWISAAGVLAVLALLLVVQAAVLGLSAATGLALHWSSLIVAAVLAIVAAIAFAKGKADAPTQLAPGRAMTQIKQDIEVAKEQFT